MSSIFCLRGTPCQPFTYYDKKDHLKLNVSNDKLSVTFEFDMPTFPMVMFVNIKINMAINIEKCM